MTKNPIKYWFYQSPDPEDGYDLFELNFECGKGWYPLLEELSDKIDAMFRDKYPKEMKDFQVLQVKEKFGTLRYYVSSAPDEIYDLIHEYEDKSDTTCELCGKTGKLTERHMWLQTLCEECFNEKR